MEKIINFRDFNGIKTKDNASIKNGAFYRSAAPEDGSDKDFETLKELNLDVYFDFRSESEKSNPRNKLFNETFNRISASIDVGNLFADDVYDNLSHLDEDYVDTFYKTIYNDFVINQAPSYQHLSKALNQGQKMLFHCTAGKDRTGFAGFIILSTLNVHEDEIMANYVESNKAAVELFERKKHEAITAFEKGLSPDTFMKLLEVKPLYLESAIKTIKERHQSIENYLTNHLNIDIDSVRDHYLN